MSEPVEDTRNELISIVRNVVEENFDVEGYIVDAFDVMIIGVSYSTAVFHLNGLFFGNIPSGGIIC